MVQAPRGVLRAFMVRVFPRVAAPEALTRRVQNRQWGRRVPSRTPLTAGCACVCLNLLNFNAIGLANFKRCARWWPTQQWGIGHCHGNHGGFTVGPHKNKENKMVGHLSRSISDAGAMEFVGDSNALTLCTGCTARLLLEFAPPVPRCSTFGVLWGCSATQGERIPLGTPPPFASRKTCPV